MDAGELAELKRRVPLTSVVGQRVKLQRRGRELFGLCPLHNEKTPSFTVNDSMGRFYCFGCGAHDVIDLHQGDVRHLLSGGA